MSSFQMNIVLDSINKTIFIPKTSKTIDIVPRKTLIFGHFRGLKEYDQLTGQGSPDIPIHFEKTIVFIGYRTSITILSPYDDLSFLVHLTHL